MPTYEYLCKSCGKRLEVQQRFTDDALTECPSCEGKLRKIFGNVGVSFKGSGFYKTDSRGSKSSTATTEPATSAPAASTESGAGSSSSGSSSSGDKAAPAKSDSPSTSS